MYIWTFNAHGLRPCTTHTFLHQIWSSHYWVYTVCTHACMCMFILVVCQIMNIIQTQGRTFFFFGRRVEVWCTLFAYALYPGSPRQCIPNFKQVYGSQIPVYRTQAPCSHIRSLVYRYSYRRNTGLLGYVNNNHHATIYGHCTACYISHWTHS